MSDTSAIESTAEAVPFIQLMFKEYLEWVDYVKRKEGLTAKEAHQRDVALGDAVFEERATKRPPDEVTWRDLEKFFERDPERAMARWQAIKASARAEWETGYRSASAMRLDTTPMERARFLAVRAALLEDREPTTGIERALLELMSQSLTAYLFWLERFTVQSMQEGHEEDEKIKAAGYWQPPRISTSESLELSAKLVEQFSKIFSRAVRTLLHVRRSTPAVVVQNATQVNVAGQQQVTLAEMRAAKNQIEAT
jgi:hypothetical protein